MDARGGFIRFFLFLGTLGLVAGCGTQREPEGAAATGPAPSGEVVAKVGESFITLSDFEAQLNQQNPLIRARFKSLEQKKKLLNNLVQREAMVLEARRLGLDEDPEMIRGYKKILARHLVDMEFNKKRVKEIEVSDSEIQRFYEENSDRYHSPEKVRVHQIFVAAASDPAKRKAGRAKAAGLLEKLKAEPNDRRLFLELARKNSDDEATRNVGGDTNFKTRAQMEESFGQAFAQAAFALKKANDLSDVIETDKGFHILRQSGRQAPIDLPIEKVKGQIRTTLFARARGEAYKQFVEEIKKKVGVEVFDDEVAKAKVDTSGATGARRSFPDGLKRLPKRPGPGGLPGGGREPPGVRLEERGKLPLPKKPSRALKQIRLPEGKGRPAGK